MTKEIAYRSARQMKALKFDAKDAAEVFKDLPKLGIGFDAAETRKIAKGFGMDSTIAPLLGVSGGIPLQFLQTFLPGFVEIVTQPTRIDDLVGVSTVGNWDDEEVVQASLEQTGSPQVYGDYTNIPLSSYTQSYEKRTVVRFEEGLRVGKLEEVRAGRAEINSAEAKRNAAARALNILRNRIGFFGFNSALGNRTYGFLNDPALPAYVSVAPGAGSGTPTEWSGKTYLEITADLREAMSALRARSGDTVDPTRDNLTLAVATLSVDYLSVTSQYGNSVMDWLKQTYPNTRVISVPELNAANSGDNVFYLYAENVVDSGTDDGRTFTQIVPTAFQLLGSEQRAKTYVEDYTNATAGVLLKRPYAVIRRTGI